MRGRGWGGSAPSKRRYHETPPDQTRTDEAVPVPLRSRLFLALAIFGEGGYVALYHYENEAEVVLAIRESQSGACGAGLVVREVTGLHP